MSEMAMITGLPSFSSIHDSSTAPTAAAGTVDSTSSHASRPSGVVGRSRWITSRSPSRTYTTRSLRK